MIRLSSVAVLVLWVGSNLSLAADKPEDQAKAAVEQFVKAVKAKDVDAVMKVAAVPWWAGGNDVIDSADGLKTYLKVKLGARENAERIPSEVLRVERWDKFPRREKLGPEAMKKVDEVVGKDGLVVTMGKEGKGVGAILVRVEGGKAKVVGVED
jgi:hypothetical protein